VAFQPWKIPLTVKHSLVQFLCTVTSFLEVLLAETPTKCKTITDKKMLLRLPDCRCTDDRYGSRSHPCMTWVERDLSTLKKIIGPHISVEQLVNSYISIAPNQRRDESGHSAGEKTNIRRTHQDCRSRNRSFNHGVRVDRQSRYQRR